MRVLSLEVKGYRSLRNVTWRPDRLNVLIGPNGGGKSNLLRALELISVAARGGLGDYIKREGGLGPLLWDGRAETMEFRVKAAPADPSRDATTDSLTYELALGRLGATSAYRIDAELLANFYKKDAGIPLEPFKFLERGAGHAVIFDPDERQLAARADLLDEQETLLSTAAGPMAPNPIVAEFRDRLRQWRIYEDIHTDRGSEMRRATVTRSERYVDADGQNLVAVLHSLYTGSREFKNEINAAMRAAFGDDFEELVFPPAADQRVQLRVRWKSLRREQSAADLSDGTLRFLFLLAVLANPLPPPLIAIDEPQVGLHPSMLPIVVEYAREAARRTQVVMTTHSPEFLDAFGKDIPATTVVECRDGATELRALADEELAHWLRAYTLGELFRSTDQVLPT